MNSDRNARAGEVRKLRRGAGDRIHAGREHGGVDASNDRRYFVRINLPWRVMRRR